MRSLILFGSKYGTTETCANKLKGYMGGEVDVLNINNSTNISLDEYDNIIIGSPVYAGMFNKDIKNFIEANKSKLINKRLGLFMCCMSDDKRVAQQFKENLPQEILERAKVKENFGGEFKFSKMNFFEKMIIKMIAKKDSTLGKVDGKTDISKIDESAIKNFAKVMEG